METIRVKASVIDASFDEAIEVEANALYEEMKAAYYELDYEITASDYEIEAGIKESVTKKLESFKNKISSLKKKLPLVKDSKKKGKIKKSIDKIVKAYRTLRFKSAELRKKMKDTLQKPSIAIRKAIDEGVKSKSGIKRGLSKVSKFVDTPARKYDEWLSKRIDKNYEKRKKALEKSK